jgi:hypothetical protein
VELRDGLRGKAFVGLEPIVTDQLVCKFFCASECESDTTTSVIICKQKKFGNT